MKLDDKGLLIIISGPSGVGKGTVREALFKMKDHDFVYSVSLTTRAPREGEENGKDYWFVTREEFEEAIRAGKMLEYAEFCGNYYGTPKDAVEALMAQGKEVVLEIEVQGAMQVMKKVPDAVSVFIAPPSIPELYRRLIERGTENEIVIQERVIKASKEIGLAGSYKYIVVNDTVENAADKIVAIVRAEHARIARALPNYMRMLEETNHD